MKLAAVFSALVLAAATVSAQVNPAFSDLNAAVEDARTIVQTERKLIVQQGLGLTPTEANEFWPLYDQYAVDLRKVNDLRVKVVTDFAASYETMSDDVAKQLLKDGLKYNQDLVKLRQKYVKKFGKVLSPVKLARFYQLENKLDAISAFALARQIPLVPAAPAPVSQPGG